ncbi:MAG: hypothetical protein WA941_18390 [Nitrososphaeraceae archaeon]
MINRNIIKTSRQEVKMAKNEGSNIEQIPLPFRILPKYRAYVSVKLKRDRKGVRPVIHAYGTDPKETCKAVFESFDKVRNELLHNGYNVAPLNSKSEKGGMLQE